MITRLFATIWGASIRLFACFGYFVDFGVEVSDGFFEFDMSIVKFFDVVNDGETGAGGN